MCNKLAGVHAIITKVNRNAAASRTHHFHHMISYISPLIVPTRSLPSIPNDGKKITTPLFVNMYQVCTWNSCFSFFCSCFSSSFENGFLFRCYSVNYNKSDEFWISRKIVLLLLYRRTFISFCDRAVEKLLLLACTLMSTGRHLSNQLGRWLALARQGGEGEVPMK